MLTIHLGLGPLVHWLLTSPAPKSLFDRFCYPAPLPDDQVELRWLGTAGFSVEHRGSVLLLDPFVSRPGMRRTLLWPLSSFSPAVSRWTPRADVIACGHSHHDHILDVPEIAHRTGAAVLGSRSTCNLCRAYGVPEEQLTELCAPASLERPPFRVTARPSRHGRALLNRVPLQGSISDGLRGPLRMRDFRSDETFGLTVEVGQGERRLSLLHLGSADFTSETFTDQRCHVLLPCLVGRHRRPGFTAELMDRLQPRVVLPHHFDDFFQPLGRPLRQLPRADLAAFHREVREAGAPCKVVTLELLGRVRFTLDGDVVG